MAALKPSKKEVEFSFHAPEAKKVCIAGQFNDWDTKSMSMKRDKNGTWRTKAKLSPGKYEYRYLVDGAWAEDVPGAESVFNPYGTNNCVITVE